jgi:hypothetical protein
MGMNSICLGTHSTPGLDASERGQALTGQGNWFTTLHHTFVQGSVGGKQPGFTLVLASHHACLLIAQVQSARCCRRMAPPRPPLTSCTSPLLCALLLRSFECTAGNGSSIPLLQALDGASPGSKERRADPSGTEWTEGSARSAKGGGMRPGAIAGEGGSRTDALTAAHQELLTVPLALLLTSSLSPHNTPMTAPSPHWEQ